MITKDRYIDWVGKKESSNALVTSNHADALSATLNRDDPPLKEGDTIPQGWHVIYFHEIVKLCETGSDGHPKRGEFLPPIDLPRRMWAGTKATYHKPIYVGEWIKKTTTIEAVTPKVGKTGDLVFLKLKHEIEGNNGIAVTEIQDVVYREEAKTSLTYDILPSAPFPAVWSRDVEPTPVLLFRFSALTMNSHRIHYDRKYVMEVENYPGLLVHGPLTQILLMDLFRHRLSNKLLKDISVRAVSPLYDTHVFKIQGCADNDGKSANLWALNHNDKLAMTLEASF